MGCIPEPNSFTEGVFVSLYQKPAIAVCNKIQDSPDQEPL